MPRLVVLSGVDEGKQFDVAGPLVTIGRHSTNAVALHDTQVSRRHLELRVQSTGDYLAFDLGSGNGTLLNGQSVRNAPIRSGDQITIGQSILLFVNSGNVAAGSAELTERVKLLASGNEKELLSGIVRTVGADAGSQILSRPLAASSDWLKIRLAGLATLYETAQAVSHIMDVDQLLGKVMELVLKSVEAEHGCIMLRDEHGNLETRVVRYCEGLNRQEELSISRTIVDHVLKENQGVLVSDAQTDARFSGGVSIHRHNIREVICVPMKGRREIIGVLYLDTHSTLKQLLASPEGTTKFSEDHLQLAATIAHQAAIAVDESRYHQALINAERLAAIGQTIAAMSHHIKNIMHGVRFGADMVRTAIAESDTDLLGKGWKLVEKNQARIDVLILDMLSFSKDREPEIEITDINKLCEDVLELLRGRSEQLGVAIEWRAGSGVSAVPCDPEGIHRALLNLVSNALDALEDRPNPKLAIQTILESDGDWVKVIVLDNGPGVPADKLDEIFKPFVSTKGARGTGLGLPVSRKILREHGGDILVQSVPEKGSKFTMRLPMKTPN